RLAAGASSVHFAARPRSTIEMQRIVTPPLGVPIYEAPAPSIATPSEGMPEMEFGDVLDDPLGEALARATPRSTQSIQMPKHSDGAGGGGLFAQFAATRAPTESPDELLRKLEASLDPHVHANLLDDLVVHAENAAKEHKPLVVTEILSRVGKREAQLADQESRRIFNLSLRKMAKPAIMRAVTVQLAMDPEDRDDYLAILTRAGEEGSDALIEQIGAVAHQRDRRVYYDALLQLKSGVSSLMHMLGDQRWFAVRNAAEILGEMHVKEAEKPLTELLRHEDERVRRAATGALMRLGTQKAMQAIQSGLNDSSPEMRSEAGAALVSRRDPRSTQMLLTALDAEKDEQVQCAFLLSLGRLGTTEAVQRLIRSAEAERGLFKKKTTAVRVAAVHGLSEARTMEATDMLRLLQTDRDVEVKDAAKFALSRISKGAAAK
ncbi:MAG: HEAT repeat domain-containing protein, partial [Gemmatimonadaceae bacterium]